MYYNIWKPDEGNYQILTNNNQHAEIIEKYSAKPHINVLAHTENHNC
jgi:hypothetical protein